eukprot:1144798-Pelagomonas_calceolata.AAC.2
MVLLWLSLSQKEAEVLGVDCASDGLQVKKSLTSLMLLDDLTASMCHPGTGCQHPGEKVQTSFSWSWGLQKRGVDSACLQALCYCSGSLFLLALGTSSHHAIRTETEKSFPPLDCSRHL